MLNHVKFKKINNFINPNVSYFEHYIFLRKIKVLLALIQLTNKREV